jgi:hypothetical protein
MEEMLKWYCATTPQSNSAVSETRDTFEARAQRIFPDLLKNGFSTADASLIYSIIGEIGNNCYDHNLGFWMDQPGCYFCYSFDLNGVVVALADRGRGMLSSLKRVVPTLSNDQEAIETAFEKVISGRSPEQRGNGLKFVRQIINGNAKRALVAKSGLGKVSFGGKTSFISFANKLLDSDSHGTIILMSWEQT